MVCGSYNDVIPQSIYEVARSEMIEPVQTRTLTRRG